MGGNQRDDYVNTAGAFVDVGPGGDIDWPNADYVVVKVVEPNGSTYWTTIVGPFDDYEDFLDHLQDWWEEGS